jgi:hypothetical protein
MDLTGQAGELVASAVRARRLVLDLRQEDAAQRGNVSLATWRKVETRAAPAVSDRTVTGIEKALGWATGSLEAIASGEPPSPVVGRSDRGEDELLNRVRVDLDAAAAWGSDQTWRLEVLRRLYNSDQGEFREWLEHGYLSIHIDHAEPLTALELVEERPAHELAPAAGSGRAGQRGRTVTRPQPEPEGEGS